MFLRSLEFKKDLQKLMYLCMYVYKCLQMYACVEPSDHLNQIKGKSTKFYKYRKAESAYHKNSSNDFLQVRCINSLLSTLLNLLIDYDRAIGRSLNQTSSTLGFGCGCVEERTLTRYKLLNVISYIILGLPQKNKQSPVVDQSVSSVLIRTPKVKQS